MKGEEIVFTPFELVPRMKGTIDSNPATRGSVDLYGETLTLAPLDLNELKVFNAQFPTLLGAPGSEERRIQIERADIYLMGIRAIKYELNAPKFRGLNPSDTELGFSKIRPQFTRIANAYRYNWQIAFAAAGTWYDWLTGAVVNQGYKVGDYFGLVITHLVSLVTPTPFVAEAHFQIGRTNLLPSDVRPIRIGDNENGIAHYPIPSMVAAPKVDLFGELMSDTIGTDELQLGGIVVGLGRILKEKVPATWT